MFAGLTLCAGVVVCPGFCAASSSISFAGNPNFLENLDADRSHHGQTLSRMTVMIRPKRAQSPGISPELYLQHLRQRLAALRKHNKYNSLAGACGRGGNRPPT